MKHRSKSFYALSIVLKRNKVGETDRIVSLLTQEYGKLIGVAKGVRKITSTKRAALEPGNLVKAYFIKTKGLPLLTQAKLVHDCNRVRTNLAEIRKLAQFLEILEKLFVEDEIEPHLYSEILTLREKISNQTISNKKIKTTLEKIIVQLGYPHPNETKYTSILDYVSSITNRPMRSFEYLMTPQQ